jgi:SAM-dependent methyltransferase
MAWVQLAGNRSVIRPEKGGSRTMNQAHASGEGAAGFAPLAAAVDAAWRDFRGANYLRHNARRQEHLATLGLDLSDRSVLELGAGIGDHTTFFLDRGCSVTSVEPRLENCHLYGALMQARLAEGYGAAARSRIIRADALSFESVLPEQFDVIYCYGLLYHTDDPARVLGAIARKCRDLLLLETCVSVGAHEAINPKPELADVPSQAVSGMGCRPTRPWIFARLSELFPHVYVPRTQPAHEEFPLDWTIAPKPGRETRAVFIASRQPLSNPLLLDSLPDRQSARS